MLKRFAVAVFILLGFANCCCGQNAAAPSAAPLTAQPITAADFFTLARQQSDIHQDGAKPFELKATFVATDEKGKKRSGQYSELWISRDQWRREVSVGDYREASSTVSGDYYHLATSDQADSAAGDVLDNITPSIPHEEDIGDANKRWSLKLEKYQGTELMLISRTMHFEDRGDVAVANYLFSPESGYIRSAQSLVQAAAYNDLHSALGRIVPYSVTVKEPGRSTLITVGRFGDPGNPPDQAFIIPGAAKAKFYSGRLQRTGSGVISGLIIKRVPPSFPDAARAAHRGGIVELQVTIGRDGRVRDINIVRSPRADLAASAVRAVREYVYKPFTLDGVPTEVNGTITVNYVLR